MSFLEQKKLTASDIATDYFGNSVSISGDYAIIGNQTTTGSGGQYIFLKEMGLIGKNKKS